MYGLTEHTHNFNTTRVFIASKKSCNRFSLTCSPFTRAFRAASLIRRSQVADRGSQVPCHESNNTSKIPSYFLLSHPSNNSTVKGTFVFFLALKGFFHNFSTLSKEHGSRFFLTDEYSIQKSNGCFFFKQGLKVIFL